MNAVLVLMVLLMKPGAMVDAAGAVPAILEAPENVTVGLGRSPLTMTCRVRGDNIFIRIDGMVFGHNTETALRARGIIASNGFHTGDEVRQTVTVEIIRRNNNTEIICHARTSNQPPADSDPAFIVIAGPPLPPRLQYSAIDENSLLVFWEEPYTAHEFPITGYFLHIVDANQMGETVLADVALSPDIQNYTVTQVDATSCSNLTFHILAQNSVGNSSVDTTYGAFLSGPGPLMELAGTVTFSQDLSPLLQINFTFPSLCPYNNASYMIEIADADQRVVHTVGPSLQYWMDSGTLMSMQLVDAGMERNAEYTVNVTVWTAVGRISKTERFDTLLPTDGETIIDSASDPSPTGSPDISLPVVTDGQTIIDSASDPSPTSSPDISLPVVTDGQTIIDSASDPPHTGSPASTRDTVEIVASACVTTILLAILLMVSILFVIYVYRRSKKRRRDCVHTTELANHVSRGMPMVVNPIYETGAIYEEIPDPSIYKSQSAPTEKEKEEGYVSISSSTAANATTSGKCFLEKGQEEMYTHMNPAGTLLGQLSSPVDSPAESPMEATIYTTIAGDDEATRPLCGQQEQQQAARKLESEERYVIVH